MYETQPGSQECLQGILPHAVFPYLCSHSFTSFIGPISQVTLVLETGLVRYHDGPSSRRRDLIDPIPSMLVTCS